MTYTGLGRERKRLPEREEKQWRAECADGKGRKKAQGKEAYLSSRRRE